MFTGIIEAVGKIDSRSQECGEWKLRIAVGSLDMSDVAIGDSISVSGCCLTVVEKLKSAFTADVSNETMRCTALGELKLGSRVNLEKAMLATVKGWRLACIFLNMPWYRQACPTHSHPAR